MIAKGKISGLTRDFKTMTPTILLTLSEADMTQLDKLSDKELTIELKPYHKKRSLDANAYLWVLCTALAEHLHTSKDEIYELMLQRYGVVEKDDSGYIVVTVKTEVDMSKISGHWKFYKTNGDFCSYLMLKGTSEYDSAEMALFLDRVVEEAKENGIETATPDEIERMKDLWAKQYQSSQKTQKNA